MRSSISFSPIRANRGGGGAMSDSLQCAPIARTARSRVLQTHWSLTLPESDLDGLGRRWWMHDASAGRPSLKLDSPPPVARRSHRPPGGRQCLPVLPRKCQPW